MSLTFLDCSLDGFTINQSTTIPISKILSKDLTNTLRDKHKKWGSMDNGDYFILKKLWIEGASNLQGKKEFTVAELLEEVKKSATDNIRDVRLWGIDTDVVKVYWEYRDAGEDLEFDD
ncbi:Protein of unknown function [Pyronema omphalodes CBS 100304]|uniref:Uncharacterized protein n=1 Tax=Pyronema omphalodes (strain CBS 100304) TaxID=1076935 RepID=U4LDQ1_PYROM|nr:Protein of unknown function [Pyronema omphalodes CBS 100304]